MLLVLFCKRRHLKIGKSIGTVPLTGIVPIFCFFQFQLLKNKTPRQQGPQWLETVHPATVSRTSEKG